MMDFLLWHAIVMIAVIAFSFGAGYYTASVKRSSNESI
tara:strand:- start:491 stop:604 length:114 start_codon:yes stop_codon:yes gene_type:complete